MTEQHATVEGRWDILYRDYPEVYDEFAAVPKTPAIDLTRLFELTGKTVADVGSGSGASTIALARIARQVIGVEIEDAMRELAERRAHEQGIGNVRFLKGDARALPLDGNSVDAVTGITLAIHPTAGFRDFAREALRVTKDGGMVMAVNVAPLWYGGELAPIILGPARREDDDDLLELDRILREEFGFEYLDVFQDQEYESLDKIVRTYGFIHGRRAIQYLIEHNKTSIRWKFRIHWRRVGWRTIDERPTTTDE